MAFEFLLDPRETPAGTIGNNPAGSGGSGGGTGDITTAVPYYIPATESFTVTQYSQALYAIFIDAQGLLIVDGVLIEVD